MAYNVTDLISQVQQKVGDSSLSSTVVTRYLNEVQREVLNRYKFPFMEKRFEGLLTVGQHSFEHQPDHQQTLSLIIIDPDEPTNAYDISEHYLPYQRFNNTWPNPSANQNSRPFYWTDAPGGTDGFRNQLYFTAPVDLAYTMRGLYVKKPTTLSSGDDVPEVPEEFQEILVLGASAKAHQRKDRYDFAQILLNEQVDIVRDMVKRLNRRQRAVTGKTRGPRVHAGWRR